MSAPVDGECIHEMAPGTCALCADQVSRPARRVSPGPPSSSPPSFRRGPAEDTPSASVVVAKFPGFCRECGSDIDPGDPLRQNDDLKWVHSECL